MCYPEILGESQAILRVIREVDSCARCSLPVLLTGEPGTGKELFARAIHRGSERAEGPFVPVNAANLDGDTVKSEVFGHVKGAFTGATSDNPGLIASADGGAFFMDEVAELPGPEQARFLRVFQEGEVRPVGGTADVKVDFRLVTATNRDVKAMVAAGIPPGPLLEDRRDDDRDPAAPGARRGRDPPRPPLPRPLRQGEGAAAPHERGRRGPPDPPLARQRPVVDERSNCIGMVSREQASERRAA